VRVSRPVIFAALAAVFVAAVGGTMTDLGPWYLGLRQPAWKPPDWLFGPAWTLIYSLTALAGIEAWRRASKQADREWVMGLFALNGFLNIMWSVFFFRFKRPDWALLEVTLLWLSILLLVLFFWKPARRASLQLLPYLAWVSYAASINLGVVLLNP
jgi:tryptophan-rich sensory protein